MKLPARLLESLRARPGLRHLASRILFAPPSSRQRFRLIWALDLWGGGSWRSGLGSTLEATHTLRDVLPRLLAELGVRTLIDVPCGEFTWMCEVDLGVTRYVGVDIVPEIVARNRERYEDADRVRFVLGDVTRDALPGGDAILCRHLLPHLSLRDGLAALEQFRHGAARWLITTTFPSVEHNSDVATGDFRAINLERPPFGLPPPLRTIDDSFGLNPDHRLGVWDIPGQLRG